MTRLGIEPPAHQASTLPLYYQEGPSYIIVIYIAIFNENIGLAKRIKIKKSQSLIDCHVMR